MMMRMTTSHDRIHDPRHSPPVPPAPRHHRLLRAVIDPGWLFLLTGLALISAAILIPPADTLAQLDYQTAVLEQDELAALDMLEAYCRFQDEVIDADPVLVERLAAAYFNQIPSDAEALAIVGVSLDARVDQWISDTIVPRDPVPAPEYKNTILRRWCSPVALTTRHDDPLIVATTTTTTTSEYEATPTPSDASLRPNPRRLWVIGAGAVLALTGLLLNKPTDTN